VWQDYVNQATRFKKRYYEVHFIGKEVLYFAPGKAPKPVDYLCESSAWKKELTAGKKQKERRTSLTASYPHLLLYAFFQKCQKIFDV